jgi:hypothetical protein
MENRIGLAVSVTSASACTITTAPQALYKQIGNNRDNGNGIMLLNKGGHLLD